MKIYVLAGQNAIRHYLEDDYRMTAMCILGGEGMLTEVENFEQVPQLINQLEGWFDFMSIKEMDYKHLQVEVESLRTTQN